MHCILNYAKFHDYTIFPIARALEYHERPAFRFFYCVASPFHSFVTNLQPSCRSRARRGVGADTGYTVATYYNMLRQLLPTLSCVRAYDRTSSAAMDHRGAGRVYMQPVHRDVRHQDHPKPPELLWKDNVMCE